MKLDKILEEKYGLKSNPFLDEIAREVWLSTWVGREEQLALWDKIISESESLEKNRTVFIIGDYGRGKTLSLLKITENAKKNNKIFPIYLTFLGEEKPKNPGLDFIFRIFKGINFDILIKNKSKDELENAIKSIYPDFSEVTFVLRNIFYGNSTEKKLALYFLSGEIKPNQTQLKKLNVIRKIENIKIAKEYLAGILGFIKSLGFSTLLIAVDEFEYLFSLVPKSQQNIYLALLRGLYDFQVGPIKEGEKRDISNMLFFIAISEDGWRNLLDMEKKETMSGGPIQPLLDRVMKSVLPPFDPQDTRELIKKRLSYNRIKGRYEDKPLIPFTEDFVDYIFEITYGGPRQIIMRCGQVLDAGLEHGISSLDKKFAIKALEERGLF